MQPNQPAPGGPPPSPYDFILNNAPQQQPQRPNSVGPIKAPSSSNGTMKRVLTVLGGLVVLVILFVIFTSITSKAGKGSTTALLDIAAEQTEVIRVANLGYPTAISNSAKNLAVTSIDTTQTSFNSVKILLSRHGHVVLPKELGYKEDKQVDAQLVTANLNNNFDETFVSLLLTDLITYRGLVKTAYDGSTNSSERQSLANIYKGVDLIITSTQAASAAAAN